MIRMILILFTVLIAAVAGADSLILPVSGSGPGDFGSQWKTDLTLHNAGLEPLVLTVDFHDASGFVDTTTFVLLGRETTTIEDIVLTSFGLESATGALIISGDELPLRKLAVSNRVYNDSPDGQFGHDVAPYRVSGALRPGDTGIIPGPADPLAARFNFGIYTVENSTVEWALLRRDGTESSRVIRSYSEGVQVQYVKGIQTLLGEDPEAGDVIYARLLEGSAIVYGSIVNNATNDPSYVPFTRTRENLQPILIGLDLNENGVVDVFDLDEDGILDRPISVATIGYSSFFRVVVSDPEGQPVTLSIMSFPMETKLIGENTVQWVAPPSRRGTSDVLIIRASDGVDTVDFTIPVNFR